MARADQEITDVVAYAQRPLVTEQEIDSGAIEFLLMVCGTNKTVYLEATRQIQSNYFREDEVILQIVWLALDASWKQFHGVTYETLEQLVRQEVNTSGVLLMQHHIDAIFSKNENGLLYCIANPGISVTATNAELARDVLRRFVIARGVHAPVRRIMQNSGQQVPADLHGILSSAMKVHIQASSLSELPVVEMAPEFGAELKAPPDLTPTGVPFVDSAIGGHRSGEVGGILGPTGGGKTTFGIHLAVANASMCWYEGQSGGTAPKFVIYVTAEESAILMRSRVWSAFFRIQRSRASVEDPFAIMTTQETLLQYEREDQRGQPRILSERERYQLKRPMLNKCFSVLDLSGSAEFPNAGTGYINEIESHVTRLVESRAGQPVSMIVIDYAGIIVQRHMEFNNLDEKKRTPLLKYFADKCRQQLAERFCCPVWVLHQLAGDTGGSSPLKRLNHTSAADSKSFAENMTVCGVLGAADPVAGIRMLHWTKTRNKANELITPAMLKIHQDFSLMVDVSSQYVISDSGSGFLSAAEAAAVGAMQPGLSRRGAVVTDTDGGDGLPILE